MFFRVYNDMGGAGQTKLLNTNCTIAKFVFFYTLHAWASIPVDVFVDAAIMLLLVLGVLCYFCLIDVVVVCFLLHFATGLLRKPSTSLHFNDFNNEYT